VGEVHLWGIFHPLASHWLSHPLPTYSTGHRLAGGGQFGAFAENMGIYSERCFFSWPIKNMRKKSDNSAQNLILRQPLFYAGNTGVF